MIALIKLITRIIIVSLLFVTMVMKMVMIMMMVNIKVYDVAFSRAGDGRSLFGSVGGEGSLRWEMMMVTMTMMTMMMIMLMTTTMTTG